MKINVQCSCGSGLIVEDQYAPDVRVTVQNWVKEHFHRDSTGHNPNIDRLHEENRRLELVLEYVAAHMSRTFTSAEPGLICIPVKNYEAIMRKLKP